MHIDLAWKQRRVIHPCKHTERVEGAWRMVAAGPFQQLCKRLQGRSAVGAT